MGSRLREKFGAATSSASLQKENESAAAKPDNSLVDAELAKYTSDTCINISPERNAELRRKIDKRVLSIMIATYFLQNLDKGTMSFASVMGIIKDTGMVNPNGTISQQYAWLSTGLFLAVLVVEYPHNFILSRVPVAKYLSFNIMAWGAVLACHAACTNFTGLLIVRILLGIFEAVCQPCFIMLTSIWYRREEQSQRVIYWFMTSGPQQIIGALLAYCFSLIESGPLKSWQWMFLILGICSIFFGVFVLQWMPDSPMRAKCFTEQEKRDMVERVRENQTGIQNKKFKMPQVIEALTDIQTWGYSLIIFTTTIPTSGLGAFGNIIIKSFGFSTLQTQLVAMGLGVYMTIISLFTAWIMTKTKQTMLVMFAFCIPSIIGTPLLMTLSLDTMERRIGLLLCYYIAFSFGVAQLLCLSLISRNIAGQTKKGVVIAVNFVLWSAGNSAGPQIFRSNDGPRYFKAFSTHLAFYVLGIILILSLRWYLKRENSKRDKLAEAGVAEAQITALSRAWEDLTDRENLSFRYVY